MFAICSYCALIKALKIHRHAWKAVAFALFSKMLIERGCFWGKRRRTAASKKTWLKTRIPSQNRGRLTTLRVSNAAENEEPQPHSKSGFQQQQH